MLKTCVAAMLLVATLPALAAVDICMYEGQDMADLARARDNGQNMLPLVREAEGKFADEGQHERFLRKMALAYGNPELSADELEQGVLQACYGE